MEQSHLKNAILISCWLPCALHAEKIKIFWCPDLAAPIAFFRGSLPPETFEHFSIIFYYRWYMEGSVGDVG